MRSFLSNKQKPLRLAFSVKPCYAVNVFYGGGKAGVAFLYDRGAHFAVLDTETNWDDAVMSVGVAIADAADMTLKKVAYYIFPEEAARGGIFEAQLSLYAGRAVRAGRAYGLNALSELLLSYGVNAVFAYNARFDKGHLPELSGFDWYDIMRIAVYKQYNPLLPETAEFCSTGRLRRRCGVENVLRLMTGDSAYAETHNALRDALDELKIMQLMALPLSAYEAGKL